MCKSEDCSRQVIELEPGARMCMYNGRVRQVATGELEMARRRFIQQTVDAINADDPISIEEVST